MTDDPTDEIVELVEKFAGSEDLPAECADEVLTFVRSPSKETEAPSEKEGEGAPNLENAEASDLRAKLAEMPIPGRIKLALFGNSVCRALLIRDGNKLIPLFVLKNPKISIKEVEEFSKNPHLADFVLRAISDSRTYMKSGAIRFNLVTNPKTPQDISLKWLKYLQAHEIKRIAKSKNLPQVVATSAKKLVAN